MNFLHKLRQPLFWKNFAKIGFPFFFILVIISLLLQNSSAVFSGDFDTLKKEFFLNGKWKRFFGFKFLIATVYAFFITYKNSK